MPAASASPAPVLRGADDPLGAVVRLDQANFLGLLVALGVALFVHAAALTVPVIMLLSMRGYVEDLRAELHDHFATEYDIDIIEEEPEPLEEELVAPPEEDASEEVEPPEPIVEPEATDAPPPDDSPYPDDPAPTPAEAADVLTSDAPVDLTGAGWDIVDKDGSKATGGGYTSKDGKSKRPVRNPHARNDGVKGGKGTGPAPPPRPKVDRSRSVSLQGGATWNDCPFPPQADLEQVDRAAVLVSVTVSPDGSARSVRVMSDPGYGFGQQAKRCAMTKRYKPALDAGGRPITASSPPIRINFSR